MGQCQTLHSISTLLWIQDIQREERGGTLASSQPPGSRAPSCSSTGAALAQAEGKASSTVGKAARAGSRISGSGGS